MNHTEQALTEDIKIDKDGIWYYRGAEMFRKDIVNTLYSHLKKDPTGRYIIELNNESVYVNVEDTPFVVKSVNYPHAYDRKAEAIELTMPDDSIETLDPATLHIGENNVLYGKTKNSDMEVRFSRKSYYELSELIKYDPASDRYYITLSDVNYYIKYK